MADPKIKFCSLYLSEAALNFGGVDKSALAGRYELRFTFAYKHMATKLSSSLEVAGVALEFKDKALLKLRLEAEFEGAGEELKRFAPYSAAHMFPHLRSMLFTLTGLGPGQALMLPFMNLTREALEGKRTKDKNFSDDSCGAYSWTLAQVLMSDEQAAKS